MSPGDLINGDVEDSGNTLPLGRGWCPAAEQNRRDPTSFHTASIDQLRQTQMVLFAQFFDGCGHGPELIQGRFSECLFEPETSIADVPGVHRMPPTDFVHIDAKRAGDGQSFGRAWRPPAKCDRLDARCRQLRSFSNVINGHCRFFKQQVDCFHDKSGLRVANDRGWNGRATGELSTQRYRNVLQNQCEISASFGCASVISIRFEWVDPVDIQ